MGVCRGINKSEKRGLGFILMGSRFEMKGKEVWIKGERGFV